VAVSLSDAQASAPAVEDESEGPAEFGQDLPLPGPVSAAQAVAPQVFTQPTPAAPVSAPSAPVDDMAAKLARLEALEKENEALKNAGASAVGQSPWDNAAAGISFQG
jgi:hypothetical protein